MQLVQVQRRRQRRRRWAILLLVLLIVAGGWWHSGRKVRRFAGTWQAIDGDQIALTLKLHQDGSGKYVFAGQGFGNEVPVNWWLEGNEVVLYHPSARWGGLTSILDNLVTQWQTWLARRKGVGERWQIVKDSDGQIQLQSPSPTSVRILRKL